MDTHTEQVEFEQRITHIYILSSMDVSIGNSTQCEIQDVHEELLSTLYFSQHLVVSMLSQYIYGGVVPYFILVTDKFLSGWLLHAFS